MNDLTPKEAIANLNHLYGMVAPDIQRSLDVAIKALERPQGEWIKDEQGIDRCSKCFHRCMEFVMGKPKDNFCIECGADMRKGGAE